jgi:hypothetical protein
VNPFHHGVAVTDKEFCPRPNLIATLQDRIASNQNAVIRGIRRVGKTSAILEAIRSYKKAGYLYINCWGKQDVYSLTTAVYEAFLSYQCRKGLSLEKLMQTFAYLRPKASMDPYSGAASISVDLSKETTSSPRSLEAVFDLLAAEGKKKPMVVVFDEFQALLQFPQADAVLATLRGAIQLQAQTTYFYLGSVRHQMDDIFNNPDRPFFKSAASIEVGPIDREVYSEYIISKFATGKRIVTPEAMTVIFDAACDITGDVQQLCSELWNCTDTGSVIAPDVIPRALERIHHAEHESNSRIIDLLTAGQVRVLLGLARLGGEQPTSRRFLTESGVAQPSSVTKALSRLIERGLVYRSSNDIKFFSPFFRTWLLAQEF